MDYTQALNQKVKNTGKQGTWSIRMSTLSSLQPETNQLNKQQTTNKHSIPDIYIANDNGHSF